MATSIGIHTMSGAAPAERAAALESIVRTLIDHCTRGNLAAPRACAKNAAVILDMHVEGIRCVLLRTRKAHGSVLSPRELEIVQLAAQGHPNKVIAGILNISSWTVGTHIRHIFAKLGVSSRTAMVMTVLETGLNEPDSVQSDLSSTTEWSGVTTLRVGMCRTPLRRS